MYDIIKSQIQHHGGKKDEETDCFIFTTDNAF